jgi:hypothetical protein
MDFADLLATATPPQRTVRICLRGDLAERWEQLSERLEGARAAQPSASLAGTGIPALSAEMDALTAELHDATVEFTVRGLSRADWRELEAAHPPRRDPATGEPVKEDAERGHDTNTFYDALIQACVVSPEITAEQWQHLLGKVLNEGQLSQLASAAVVVSRGTVDVPFFTAVSPQSPNSGGGSAPHNGSASASNASTAGSLASPSSTTTPDD